MVDETKEITKQQVIELAKALLSAGGWTDKIYYVRYMLRKLGFKPDIEEQDLEEF